MQELNLANLGGGAVLEKFADELEKTIENILDPNTEAKVKREVTIKVTISPTDTRTWGEIQIAATSKLAPTKAFVTRAYFGVDNGRHIACEDNPEQLTLDDFKNEQQKVSNLTPKKAEEENQ